MVPEHRRVSARQFPIVSHKSILQLSSFHCDWVVAEKNATRCASLQAKVCLVRRSLGRCIGRWWASWPAGRPAGRLVAETFPFLGPGGYVRCPPRPAFIEVRHGSAARPRLEPCYLQSVRFMDPTRFERWPFACCGLLPRSSSRQVRIRPPFSSLVGEPSPKKLVKGHYWGT